MNEFWKKNKITLIVSLATIAIIVGGVLLLGKDGAKNTTPTPISSSILTPQGVYQTSGYQNGDYLAASPSAKVSIVEFGDYECPACGLYEPLVKKILTDYAGKVTYTFRNYPLPQHKNAPISSYAVEAAGIQGKYWQMHEKMFVNQSQWSNLPDPTDTFIGYAKELGLNTDQFKQDLNSQKVKDVVERDTQDGNKVKLTETPTFYVNEAKVSLTGDPALLESLVKQLTSE